jgi:divalent metal cation (Fe/Co/Zn/Cd) transporter
MAWTVAVAAVAITAGVVASSIALIGLGLESVIELIAAAIVIWHLGGGGEDRESRAIRLIGIIFLVSAVYLLAEGIRELASQTHSGPSAAGLAVAGAALLVLPVLALGKWRTGQALGSRTLIADATETAMAGLAAAAALLGTGLDTWLGWWWTVPAAGLAIALLAAMEGIEVWRHGH